MTAPNHTPISLANDALPVLQPIPETTAADRYPDFYAPSVEATVEERLSQIVFELNRATRFIRSIKPAQIETLIGGVTDEINGFRVFRQSNAPANQTARFGDIWLQPGDSGAYTPRVFNGVGFVEDLYAVDAILLPILARLQALESEQAEVFQDAINTLKAELTGEATAAADTFEKVEDLISALSSTITATLGLKAPLANPAFTGTPTAPTAAPGTNTTQLATTAFVKVATDAAAAASVPLTQKGAANGVAGLDSGGKVPATQLPSYVDDVIEAANFAALPAPGETGKIFVTLNDGKVFRWSGSAYVEIVASPGSTDAVPEGFSNRYFTDARAQAALTSQLAAKQNTLTGVTGVVNPATGVARAIEAADVPALPVAKITGLETALDGKAGLSSPNTFTDELTIAIPASTSNGKQYLTASVGTLGAPMGPFTSAYGYAGGSITQFVTPSAPAGGEPNADAIYPALSIKSTFVGGARGINCALLLNATNVGHSGGGSFESGLCTLFVDASTNGSDTIFSMGLHTNITASAGGLGRIAEMDFIATGATVLERIGNVIVSTTSDVAAVNSTLTMSGGATIPVSFANEVVTIGSGRGFDYGFAAVTVNGGAQAVNKGVVFGSGTPEYGLDFRFLAPTQAAIALSNQSRIRSRNVAGTALVDMIWVAGDNAVVVGPDSAITVSSDKHLRAYGEVSVVGANGLTHRKTDGSAVARFGYRPDLNGGNDDIVLWPAISTAFRIGMDARPLATNTNDLGSSSLRWKTIYLQNAPDVVSDARLKTDFKTLPEPLLRAGRAIADKYLQSWRWKSEPGGKRQIGPTVQDVITAFTAEGLDPHEWALIGIHPVTETVETDEPVMTTQTVTRKAIEQRPRTVEKTRKAVHWDDRREYRIRSSEQAEWQRAVKQAEREGREPPPPLPDDGWRPRLVDETYLEEVAEVFPETDDSGAPVMIEVPDTDETGRVRVVDGQTAYKSVQKMRREIVYDEIEVEIEEAVPVQMTKPDGSLVWRSEERPVIDPETNEPAVRYSLNHDQLNYLMTAALAAEQS